MKKRNKFLMKLGILCIAFVGLITALVVPTKAYYVDSNGNLASSNLFDITSYSYISENANVSNDTMTFNYVNNTNIGQFIIQALDSNQTYISNVIPLQDSLGQYSYTFTKESSWSYFSFKRNGNLEDYSIIYPINLTNGDYTFSFSVDRLGPGQNTVVSKIMLNEGTTALSYEPYGVWYSQANYNAYGSEQYNEGVNDVYNSLQQQPIAQSSNVGGATLNYDLSFYNNITFTDVTRQGDYIELTWNSVGGKYSSIAFSFDSDYYITNVTLSSLNPPFVGATLIIQGYEMDIDYVNNTWGFYNISSIYNGSTRSIVIRLSASSSTSVTIRFKINSLIASIADAQTAYNTGYENGYRTAEDSYIEQVTQLESANATLQSQINMGTTNANALFWTIAATPFESFKTIWNVDVLGLNISGFVLGVLLALIILYIIKKVW